MIRWVHPAWAFREQFHGEPAQGIQMQLASVRFRRRRTRDLHDLSLHVYRFSLRSLLADAPPTPQCRDTQNAYGSRNGHHCDPHHPVTSW
jgi:hypothetical protein